MRESTYWNWTDAWALLTFSAVFLLLVGILKLRRPKGFPPGPPGIPIFGNIFSIDYKKAHLDMTKIAEKYGDVYSLRMGRSWTVVLNGFKAVKMALVTHGEVFADRPKSAIADERGVNLGVIDTSGHQWKRQRRFALQTLRQFGFGRQSLELAIHEEFTHLAKVVTEQNGKPFDPHWVTNNAVSNIICSLVFGHRFEYSDKRFQAMMKVFDRALVLEGTIWGHLFEAFPAILRHLPGPHQQIREAWKAAKDFIRIEVEEHKKTRDPDNPRDYIDCYLSEIEKDDEDVAAGFHEENLLVCAMDLFVAGSETTSTTLRWAFLYMAKYPEVQEKVQAEIDGVIGHSRQPTMADRADLPYTEAVVHEVQRIGNIVPLSLPRMTTQDIQLGEHFIPKGTEVITNLTSVMFDKNEWETPSSFNPEHFLNENKKFVKPPAFIPFSAGKRVCLGESLAKMELFLFFSCFMQRFTFSMPAGVKPEMGFRFGVTLAPLPHDICGTPRHAN